ncbi:DUF5681 domain-containing protein [Sphingomonas sp. Tas61C01]|uniref:DUF5681 domain-containing protein n=1 Tax=Sphingomonas sp. Tas61C01 TaxID=3458297 RepID=UPI00403EB456
MPFISVSEANARRAKAAAAAQVDQQNATPLPNSSNRDGEPNQSSEPSSMQPAKRRGHALKSDDGKWLPTGPGPGWCNPPLESRFQKGGRGEPGRPKGSVSHDRVMKKLLVQKRTVRVDGKETKIAAHELIVMTTVKAAAEGKDRDARKYVLSEAARLLSEGKNRACASSL